ncbi:hypothetical protein BCR34DRAFT_481239 [Clohesyomyces aquaticus]|uniref:WIBG Mago-binding domain-containing protein n=1 Tax=Clohesyomyces aquaticus TaxID=1231657 RepID=A0A1Y1ZSX6_9PLEO|nr:hypothetical protein BCR34DRAFT_481239 [Clohesyomyces aquaticus]
MPTIETTELSKAGIATTATGQRHIPSSTRPDGTVRKEIRVRPGYRPPEDVEVYKNRTAEAWKNRGSGGVPGADGLKSENDPAKGAATNKNAKRREARKKAAASTSQTDSKEGENAPSSSDGQPTPGKGKEAAAPPAPMDPEVEKEKEAKKLTKKLRQARDLKDKKEKGDVLLPEQFEKVIKINELIRQLEAMGFDANGDKKAES